jgi:hypothetical protein
VWRSCALSHRRVNEGHIRRRTLDESLPLLKSLLSFAVILASVVRKPSRREGTSPTPASSSLAASQLVPRDFFEARARRASDASVQYVGDQQVEPSE